MTSSSNTNKFVFQRIAGYLFSLVAMFSSTALVNADELFGIVPPISGMPAELIRIDLETRVAVSVGEIGSSSFRSLTFDSNNNIFYSIGAGGVLNTIDPNTGFASPVGPTGSNFTTAATFDLLTDTLYATVDIGNTSQLITVDTTTGDTTAVGPIGEFVFAQTFDSSGILYGIDDDEDLLSIDPTSGGGTLIGNTGLSVLQNLTFDDVSNQLFGFDSLRDELVRIDPNTGVSTLLGPVTLDGIELNQITGLSFASPVIVPEPSMVSILGMVALAITFRRRNQDKVIKS